jgi:hypothetical protein
MSPPRFVHKKISAAQFNAELARQNLSLPAFTRIWCQNLTTTTRWGNGQQDIPTWVPIALTADNFERLVAGTESRADMAERSQRDLLVEMKKWKARALEAEAALKSLTSQKEPTAAGD